MMFFLDLDKNMQNYQPDSNSTQRIGYGTIDNQETETNRTIRELGPMYYHQTRFTVEELEVLWDLFFGQYPNDYYIFNKHKIRYEETMLTALDYT